MAKEETWKNEEKRSVFAMMCSSSLQGGKAAPCSDSPRPTVVLLRRLDAGNKANPISDGQTLFLQNDA